MTLYERQLIETFSVAYSLIIFYKFYRLIVWSGEGKKPSNPESESDSIMIRSRSRSRNRTTTLPYPCYILGRIVITIFQSTERGTSHYSVFCGVDSELELNNIDFEKNLPARALWNILKIHLKSKKQNLKIIKWGPVVSKLTRRF